MTVSKRSAERAVLGLKRLLPIVQQQMTRDVSEADTVTLVKDVMAEAFGFDKYVDITSEHAIRGTYCDLAVRIDEKVVALVEVKSAGTSLDDRHVKQAIDYAANEGVVWVVLTNGSVWRLYEVTFGKPIDKRLLLEVDITKLDLRKDECIACLAPFMKEGFAKGAQDELRDRQDATSRYVLAALILNNDNVIGAIRRELRRVVDVLVDDEEIVKVLAAEVLKRETMDGPEAEAAVRRVNRVVSKRLREKAAAEPTSQPTATANDNDCDASAVGKRTCGSTPPAENTRPAPPQSARDHQANQ